MRGAGVTSFLLIPDDVLCLILTLASGGDLHRLLEYAAVCRDWRRVALTAPELHIQTASSGVDLDDSVCRNMALCVERFCQPLSIILPGREESPATSRRLLETLSEMVKANLQHPLRTVRAMSGCFEELSLSFLYEILRCGVNVARLSLNLVSAANLEWLVRQRRLAFQNLKILKIRLASLSLGGLPMESYETSSRHFPCLEELEIEISIENLELHCAEEDEHAPVAIYSSTLRKFDLTVKEDSALWDSEGPFQVHNGTLILEAPQLEDFSSSFFGQVAIQNSRRLSRIFHWSVDACSVSLSPTEPPVTSLQILSSSEGEGMDAGQLRALASDTSLRTLRLQPAPFALSSLLDIFPQLTSLVLDYRHVVESSKAAPWDPYFWPTVRFGPTVRKIQMFLPPREAELLKITRLVASLKHLLPELQFCQFLYDLKGVPIEKQAAIGRVVERQEQRLRVAIRTLKLDLNLI